MKKLFLLLLIGLLLIGCKTGKNSIPTGYLNKNQTELFILTQHSNNAQLFDNAIIKGEFDFTTSDQNLEATMEIRIEKDKKIIIQIRKYSFAVAKILITPDSVYYYNTLNNTFFEGNFTTIHRILGSNLQYNHLQNLLLGQAIDSEINGEIISTMENGLHKLRVLNKETSELTYFLEDKSALLKKEEITPVNSNRKLIISYPDYQKCDKYMVPTTINILSENEKNLQLNIHYNKVSFNEKVPFKYKVPNNYKRIRL